MADAIIRARPSGSFYVYLHRRATDGSVFYVGKGRGNRATRTDSRNQYWRNVVAKHGFVVDYIVRDVQEWYAHEVEREQITYYGRDQLCNLTDGGEGGAGLLVSEETRAKKSAIQRGRTHPLAVRSKISEGVKRAGTSAGPRKPLTPEHRARLSDAAKRITRKPPSEEARRNMRAAALGRSISPGQREKIAAAMRLVNGTPERRQLFAEQMKARRAKQRADRLAG